MEPARDYPSPSMGPTYPQQARDGKTGMMDRLDGELQRLSEEIEQLEHILGGVRSISPERLGDSPQEAPASRFHEFILRVETANQRLRTLKSELHL